MHRAPRSSIHCSCRYDHHSIGVSVSNPASCDRAESEQIADLRAVQTPDSALQASRALLHPRLCRLVTEERCLHREHCRTQGCAHPRVRNAAVIVSTAPSGQRRFVTQERWSYCEYCCTQDCADSRHSCSQGCVDWRFKDSAAITSTAALLMCQRRCSRRGHCRCLRGRECAGNSSSSR
jgi:hypothetical protein